jgi:hypothetical protein
MNYYITQAEINAEELKIYVKETKAKLLEIYFNKVNYNDELIFNIEEIFRENKYNPHYFAFTDLEDYIIHGAGISTKHFNKLCVSWDKLYEAYKFHTNNFTMELTRDTNSFKFNKIKDLYMRFNLQFFIYTNFT